jgi:hypothetical protein
LADTIIGPQLQRRTWQRTFVPRSSLQDEALANAARSWRRHVLDAYEGFFTRGTGTTSLSGSRDRWRPTLQDWLWAVASNESRAFGLQVGMQARCPVATRKQG